MTGRSEGEVHAPAAEETEPVYEAATALALARIQGCDAASVATIERGRPVAVRGATSNCALTAETLQRELREGPTHRAAIADVIVWSPSIAEDSRWPAWRSQVVSATSLRGVATVRLRAPHCPVTVLSLYSERPHALTAADEERIAHLARDVTNLIAASERAAHLHQALQTRTLIGQAVGILAERYQISLTTSFALLARIASAEQVKVRDLAASVVAGRPLPGADSPRNG